MADALGAYVKLKAVGKAAKGARRAAKGAAAYQVAKRAPVLRRLPLVAAAGVAAFAATKLARGGEQSASAA